MDDLESELPAFRYSTVFRSILIIDMLAIISLWLFGAYMDYETREIDQILKFNFTESIFDITLISSIKAMILFILISELEKLCLKIISISRTEAPETSTEVTLSTAQLLVNNEEDITNSNGINELNVNKKLYQSFRKLLHILILLFTFSSCIYCVVKFIIILELIVNPIEVQHPKLPMSYFFFSVLVTELTLTIIESVLACLSWMFMRKLPLILQSQAAKQINIMRLIGLSYPERHLIIVAFISLIISSLTNIAVPFFFGSVVDSAVHNKNLDNMNKYILYMFIIFVIGSIAGGIRSWLFELAGQRVVARLRRNVFSAIIKQDIQFFDTNRTGELTSRISSDSQVLQNAVTSNISMFARYLFQIVGSVILMFTLEPSLTGLLIAVIPIVSFSTVFYGRYLRKLRKKFQDDLAASSVIAEEAISSSRTVRAFAAEDKVRNEYQKNIEKSFEIGKSLAGVGGGFMMFVGLLSGGALSLVLWYGAKLVHDGKISTGLLASFLMYTLQVAMAFAFLSSLYGDFMQALGASQRIFELLDKKPTIPLNVGFKPKDQKEDEETFDGSLSFNDVCFTYPTRPDKVLKNISFVIEKGKTYALVGPSGGGKSTIIALIERFYDPDKKEVDEKQGKILVGPKYINIKDLNTNYLHSKIALVSQEPVLFGGTIKQNICFGIREHIDDERIIQVAMLANAHDFIQKFEKGYDTVVGERGIRLSGGQKQRIAIARALLINPKLLLLDEATSALDAESEHLVQEAIERAMKDRTVIIIAHRLSTVRNADKVMVIDQGSLVEQGTHQELCEMDGIYKRLVLRQLVDKETTKSTNES